MLRDYTNRIYIAESRTEIIQFIQEIYEIYQERKKSNDKGIICVVIKNLQYVDIIKSMFKGERIDEKDYLEIQENDTDEIEEPFEEQEPTDIFAAFHKVVAARNTKKDARKTDRKADAAGYSNEKIVKMMEDGSGFGIHFVVTSTDYQTVKETMRFGENVLAKFPERVVFL